MYGVWWVWLNLEFLNFRVVLIVLVGLSIVDLDPIILYLVHDLHTTHTHTHDIHSS